MATGVPILIYRLHTLSFNSGKNNETAVGLHVYRKGPPLGVGWVMQGWGGSYRGGVDHTGVGVGHTRVGVVTKGWGGSCRGEVGHARVGWVIQG